MYHWILIVYAKGSTNIYGESIAGQQEQWACNKAGEGVFRRDSRGDWKQQTGTGQAGPFRKPKDLRDWMRAHYEIRGARIIDSGGWE